MLPVLARVMVMPGRGLGVLLLVVDLLWSSCGVTSDCGVSLTSLSLNVEADGEDVEEEGEEVTV